MLKSNDNEYIFASAYEHEMAVRTFKHGNLSNPQYVERFNTKYEVAKSVGVQFGFYALWEHCAKELHKKSYKELDADQRTAIREDAEERYISYILVHNSSNLQESLRTDLLKQFSQGDNKFPITQSQVLQRLNTWSKSAPQGGSSEGTAFAQKGGKQGGRVIIIKIITQPMPSRVEARRSQMSGILRITRIEHVLSVERRGIPREHVLRMTMHPHHHRSRSQAVRQISASKKMGETLA